MQAPEWQLKITPALVAAFGDVAAVPAFRYLDILEQKRRLVGCRRTANATAKLHDVLAHGHPDSARILVGFEDHGFGEPLRFDAAIAGSVFWIGGSSPRAGRRPGIFRRLPSSPTGRRRQPIARFATSDCQIRAAPARARRGTWLRRRREANRGSRGRKFETAAFSALPSSQKRTADARWPDHSAAIRAPMANRRANMAHRRFLDQFQRMSHGPVRIGPRPGAMSAAGGRRGCAAALDLSTKPTMSKSSRRGERG